MLIAENINRLSNNEDELSLYPFSFRYLHGEIECINGYDICYCDNKEELELLNTPGIYTVSVDIDGTIYECKAYIWNDKYKRIKGLIVLSSNKEDNEYALSKYEERALVL